MARPEVSCRNIVRYVTTVQSIGRVRARCERLARLVSSIACMTGAQRERRYQDLAHDRAHAGVTQ